MKKVRYGLVCAVLLSCVALGQMTKSEQKTVAQVLDGGLKQTESEFVSAADAMPEDKYSFAPSNGDFKGVRTFAQQVKHVAAVNYIVGAAILGEKPPVDVGGESGPEAVKSKADIMKFLKDSFEYAHKATASVDEKNMITPMKSPFGNGETTRLSMATVFSWHAFDHYGQMVEYLRMNSIIPPASRQ
ncbi:MAG TPA: DinB family protein [Terriglobales bacterium]|nr:DinB family protein [Terriglobales bacterium]